MVLSETQQSTSFTDIELLDKTNRLKAYFFDKGLLTRICALSVVRSLMKPFYVYLTIYKEVLGSHLGGRGGSSRDAIDAQTPLWPLCAPLTLCCSGQWSVPVLH